MSDTKKCECRSSFSWLEAVVVYLLASWAFDSCAGDPERDRCAARGGRIMLHHSICVRGDFFVNTSEPVK
jgi:hypothetical protein